MKKDLVKVEFSAPLKDGDTEEITVGCRANNPAICAFNSISDICAYTSEDGMCRKPSRAWKKQYQKLKERTSK